MAQQTIADTLTDMAHNARQLGLLYLEKGRLKLTEKLSVLLSTVAFSAVVAMLGLLCLVFVSIGIAQLIATVFEPYIAYLIIAVFYLLSIILIAVFRHRIFTNPVSRFMSRLIVEKPDEEHPDIASPNDEPQTQPDDYDTTDKTTSRP